MNFTKFAAEAAGALSRAVQYTGEKLGKAERTEYDAHFENLLHRADQFQMWTEKLLHATEAFIQPNPALRAEDYVFVKFEQKKRFHTAPATELGALMTSAGNELGPGTAYGNCLIQCGDAETAIGVAQQEFNSIAAQKFLRPLRNYLEEDLKTVLKERKLLEQKRVEMDACKTRLKWANNEAAKKAVKMDTPVQPQESISDKAKKIANELKIAESEFERQLEVTKLLLDSIGSTQAYHHKGLTEMVRAQAEFYSRSHQIMQDLQVQLGSYPNNVDSNVLQ